MPRHRSLSGLSGCRRVVLIVAAPSALVVGDQPASNVVQVDSNTSGVSNSLPLVDSAKRQDQRQWNTSFGSLPGRSTTQS
jgi:hypothetical protein